MMVRRIFACAALALLVASAVQARQDTAPVVNTATSAATALSTASATASSTADATRSPTASPTAPPTASPAATPSVRPAPAQSAPVQPFAGAAAGILMQTIFALCLVLGLLALFAWAMKRYGPKAAGGSAHIRMVGGLTLGGRERIIVVEVGDLWIVVGASPGRVNALATMPKQGDAPVIAGAELHPHQKSASSFADWLKQTIDKRNGN